MRLLIAGYPGLGANLLRELLITLFHFEFARPPSRVATNSANEYHRHWIETITTQNVIAHTLEPPGAAILSAIARSKWRVLVPIRSPEYALKAVHQHLNSDASEPPKHYPQHLLYGRRMHEESVRESATTHLRNYFHTAELWIETGVATRVRYDQLLDHPESSLSQLADALGLHPAQDDFKKSAALLKQFRTGNIPGNSEQFGPDIPVRPQPAERRQLSIHLQDGDFPIPPTAYSGRDSDGCALSARIGGFQEFLSRYSTTSRLFLVGYGKSGTTWLSRMLGRHPECVAIGERKLIESPSGNPALLNPLLEGDFFDRWFKGSSVGINFPDESTVRYDLARLQSDYLVYRAFQRRIRGPRLSDEYTPACIIEKIALNDPEDARRLLKAFEHLYPGAKIIHIVRDPRDIIVSSMFHRYRELRRTGRSSWLTEYLNASRTADWRPEELHSYRVANYAKDISGRWAACVDVLSTNANTDKMRSMITIRYEDLIADTGLHLANLYEFAGLDSSPTLVRRIVAETKFSTMAKGRKPGMEDPDSPVRKGVSGDWINYLQPGFAETVEAMAGDAMKRFGYCENR
jgi:hypothetical protein